jgi:hypothetical protein
MDVGDLLKEYYIIILIFLGLGLMTIIYFAFIHKMPSYVTINIPNMTNIT